ncbi:MAG: PIG-L family deacetylase [Anaerolineae bacterium]|nr:PIG-L family deacetylase [Anaerolineae bacterium]
MQARRHQHIYLSPHLDDVVLSCGGALHAQTRAGERALVATFFAASPQDDEATAFARELKARWGSGPDPVALRRAEDLAALRVLAVDGLHLPYADCVYRHDPSTGEAYYPDEPSIFGAIHRAESGWDRDLTAAFLDAVGDLSGATIYAPLGAGHHVDHLLVQRVGFALLLEGQRVLFYEDYPYADSPEVLRAALQILPGECWSRERRGLREENLQAKIDAVACYASQINTFWKDAQGRADLAAMRCALRAYARVDSRDGYAERLWRLAPGCAAELRSSSDPSH